MLLQEMKRGIYRKSFIISVIIGIVICGINAIEWRASENILSDYFKEYVFNAYDYFQTFGLGELSNLFIMIIPIISSLAYSDSYLEDLNSGMLNFIYSRKNKKKYLISKYISNFILGGLVVAIPLIVNYIILITRLPSIQPHPILGNNVIGYTQLLPNIYYTHPQIYIFIWIGIYFLYGGAFASIGLGVGVFVRKRILTLISPFIILNTLEIICEVSGNTSYYPGTIFFGQVHQNLLVILVEFIFIISISLGIFIFGGRKNEVI